MPGSTPGISIYFKMSEEITRKSRIIERACDGLNFYKRWATDIITDIDYFETFYGNPEKEFKNIVCSYKSYTSSLKKELRTKYGQLVKNKHQQQLEDVVNEMREMIRLYGKKNRKLPLVRTKNVLG